MIKEEIVRRGLPSPLPIYEKSGEGAREEIKKILSENEYGFLPPFPDKIEFEIVKSNVKENFAAGKATLSNIIAKVDAPFGHFEFPFYSVVPKNKNNIPAIVHINFRSDIPDAYQPTEELIDLGFAVFTVNHKEVTSDNADMTDGLSGVLFTRGRKDNDCGKIMMWAWAAMRVMDYIETLPEIDKNRVAVCGHSRLGKTALVTAAYDERFSCAYSNDSGCSGAAITRGKIGERIADICKTFPYWFCENYKKYIDGEDDLPFDQHWLAGLIAPRCVYVASAVEDEWADPFSEYLCCHAASPVFEKYGKGFVAPDRAPLVGDVFHEGRIGYHLRDGCHYFSREDWQKFAAFFMKHC